MASLRLSRRADHLPLATACLLLGFLLAAPAQQQPPSVVTLSFTAFDKDGRPAPALRKEDIRVLEDGVPQEVSELERREGQPLSIILALDMSLSLENVIPLAKEVAQQLIRSSLRPGKDSVGVLRFTGEATFTQEPTGDLEQARRSVVALEFEPPPGYVKDMGGKLVRNVPPSTALDPKFTTAFWDALWLASEKLSDDAGTDARRLIIVFTDGHDTSSKRKFNEVIEHAIKARVAVYSIGVGEEYYGGVNKGELRKLSERTGGRASFPVTAKELREVFAELKQELASQYVVTYSPAAPYARTGKLRKIKIEIVNPELRKQKLRLLYRQGYYARSAPRPK